MPDLRPTLARPARALLGALVATLALAACRSETGTPERRTLIDSRDRYDPRSLDPALSTDVPTGRAVSYVFDGLTRFTPDAELEPALATGWEVSADGRVYTFTLRQGVTFHDGTPFTSRHVLSSWRRVLDPATRGGRPLPLEPIQGARAFQAGEATSVAGLSAPDDHTLVVTLDEPLAIFPRLLAMPMAAIVPDPLPANFAEQPVGTGPWRLVEWRRDDHLLFARHDQYWGGPPQAESLLARIIPEPSTAVAEFESGNVDVLEVPEGETRQWEQTDERRARLQTAPALRLYYVALNTTRGPLADTRVRQAINHAVDVPTILQTLAGGRGRLAAGVIPPALAGADTARAPYGYDVARARQLLTEAGHPDGIDLELWSSTTPPFPRMAEAIQGQLREAGIRVTLVQREAAAAREASRNGQVDMLIKDWFADYPDAENFLYPLLHSANRGPGGNVSFFVNATYDDIVARARRTTDDAAREALYAEADALAFREAPMVFLWFYNDLYAVQPWIQGFEVPSIFNGQRWLNVRIGGLAQP